MRKVKNAQKVSLRGENKVGIGGKQGAKLQKQREKDAVKSENKQKSAKIDAKKYKNRQKSAKIDAKKYKNKRFMETEKAILEAFYDSEGEGKVGKLTENAKIARSTFYNHHRNFYQIMPDLERKTLADFGREAESALGRNFQVQTLMHQMLVFIRRNRWEFQVIVDRGDERTLEAMIDDLLPRIAEVYHLPKESGEILRVYQKEITGIVETWILGNFRPGETEVLGDMMYMTNTARRRLMALKH